MIPTEGKGRRRFTCVARGVSGKVAGRCGDAASGVYRKRKRRTRAFLIHGETMHLQPPPLPWNQRHEESPWDPRLNANPPRFIDDRPARNSSAHHRAISGRSTNCEVSCTTATAM